MAGVKFPYIKTDTLKRIIQGRALELKAAGHGYLETIRIIAEELVQSADGKPSPLGGMGAAHFPISPSALIELIKTIWKIAERVWNQREAGDQQAKARQELLAEIQRDITPWVDEAWQQQVRASRE